MKQLFSILIALSLCITAFGQKKLSSLPFAPLVNTNSAMIGVQNNSGVYTDYRYSIDDLGTYILSLAGTPVTSITIATANGLQGSSSGGATPALTLRPAAGLSGMVKVSGTSFANATAGTDYQAALTGTGFVKSAAGTISYPTTIDLSTEVANNLAISHLNSGTSATSSTFWRGDGTWATPPGATYTAGIGLGLSAGNVFSVTPVQPNITTISNLTSNGFVKTGGGIGTLSISTAVSLTADVSGQLPLANGGTNANLTASNGGIFYSTGSAGAILSGTATANKMLLSGSSTTPAWSTSTIPTSAGTAGKVLISDGTNYVLSTPTYPNASATSRKIIVSDGTNFVASTETYAVPGTSGNVLTSDGTNWTSAAPVVTASNTITFTNKRWTARVSTATTVSATPSINTDNYDVVKFTAQTANITSMTTNLTGTPVDGDIICFELTAGSGTPTVAWGASFANSTINFPTALSTTTVTVIARYSTSSSYGNNKWICAKTY